MKIRKWMRLMLYTLGISGLMQVPAMAQTDVHILDVGQGLSVFVESRGQCMLYDGGDSSKSSFVVSYLKQQNVSSLDYVIASHYDSDHLNGVVGALNVFPTGQIYAPDYETDTRVFRSFKSITAEKQIPVTQPEVGSVFQLGDASIQILAPSGSGYSDVNNYSIAIRIEDGDKSFLITGDAEAESEAEMVAAGLDLESDVYVMGHHGSGTSTSWALLEQAVPEYAVLSCGAGNSYGHPHAESMEKLQTMDIQLFRTDRQGTIIGSMDDNRLTWNTDPCNDYTPGDPDDKPAQPSKDTSTATPNGGSSSTGSSATTGNSVSAGASGSTGNSQGVATTESYILNTNTKKIHRPSCKSVNAMSEKNKKSTSESLESLIQQGYSPCKNCNPS